MRALADDYDLIGFDLDGVIYRGPEAVPNAVQTVAELRRRGVTVAFVTNNAQRSPKKVADHLASLGIPAEPKDVVTSAQSTARVMAEALPGGSEVFVLGSHHLKDEIAAHGLKPVEKRSGDTVAICVGFDSSLTWDSLNQACYAVQDGAIWYATNNDYTRPTDKGIAIGMGGVLAAMRLALPGLEPVMGGKPARALFDETVRRTGASRPLFVGDRLDTDVEGAHSADADSLFVLSGAQGPADLVAAVPAQRPTFLASDVSGLLDLPRHAVPVDGGRDRWSCGAMTATAAFDLMATLSRADGKAVDALVMCEQRLDALWAVSNLVWEWADRGAAVDAQAVLRMIGDF